LRHRLYFTRRFAAADARRLPFPDDSFDLVVSITALCFIREERLALREMLRVARRWLPGCQAV